MYNIVPPNIQCHTVIVMILPGTADNGKYVSPPKSSEVRISLSNNENWIIAFFSWH